MAEAENQKVQEINDISWEDVELRSVDSNERVEATNERFGSSFTDNSIRNSFIRKVYGIILAELLLVSAIVLVVNLTEIRDSIYENNASFYVFIGLIVFYILLSLSLLCCYNNIGRKYPVNLIVLTLLMILLGGIISIITAYYKEDTILIAGGLTLLIVILLTLFSFTTKIDFTSCLIYLIVLSSILGIVGLASLFVGLFASDGSYYIMRMVYSGLGVLVVSFSLIYDTQLILIGKHKYSHSADDYTLAAFSILTDIVQLFLYLLTLVGGRR